MSLRIVKPEKIRQMRGNRSLRSIAEAAGRKFTHGALWQWESPHLKVRPTIENIPALLKGLGCSYEDISEPVEVEQ